MKTKLFGYEFRKLLTKRSITFVILLLALDFCTCFYYAHAQAKAERYDEREVYAEVFSELESTCMENPQEAIAYYEVLKTEHDIAYEEWEQSLLMNPIGPGTSTFYFSSPSTLIEGYEDWALFDAYMDWVNDYPTLVGDTVAEAEHNIKMLEVFGITDDSPNGIYQQKLVELYPSVLAESDPSPSIASGWNEYFAYEYGFLFLALAILVMVIQLGLCDRESGMDVILHVSRKGRWERGFAQSLSFLSMTGGMCVLFKLSELFAVSLGYGLSDPTRSIQNIGVFTFCPYAISILEGALLQLALTFLAACVFALFCLLVAALSRGVIVTVAFGVLLIGYNMVCYFFQNLFEWQSMNLLSLAYGDHFRRLSPMVQNALGRSTLPFAVGVFAYCLLLCLILILPVYQLMRPKMSGQKLLGRIGKTNDKLIKSKKPLKVHSMGLGLFRGEIHKQLRPLTVLALLLLVGFHVQQNLTVLSGKLTDEESRIATYIEKYGEAVDPEILNAMYIELDEMQTYISDETESVCQKRYLTGEITADEYYAYKVEQSRLKISMPALQATIGHMQYLLSLEEQGIEATLFYDHAYLTLFGRGFDQAYYLIVILLTAGVFAVEYKQKFIDILSTTRYGRGRMLLNKYVFAILSSAVVGIGFALFDFSLFVLQYGLAGYSAKLVCIEAYADFSPLLTVGGYLWLYLAFRILAGILLAVMITGLSALIVQIKLVLPLTAGVTVLPYAFGYLGFTQANLFDYTNLLDGNQFMMKLFQENGWYYIIFPIAIIIFSLASYIIAKRKFS